MIYHPKKLIGLSVVFVINHLRLGIKADYVQLVIRIFIRKNQGDRKINGN